MVWGRLEKREREINMKLDDVGDKSGRSRNDFRFFFFKEEKWKEIS